MKPRRRPLATVALAVAISSALVAQQRWYELYDQGIEHVRRGEWEAAETKLKESQKIGPSPGRNVLRYGMLRGHFFPDFFLGVVFLNTNRPTEALREFALARAQKVNPQDREFQTIADMEGQARIDETRLADATAMPTVPQLAATAADTVRVENTNPASIQSVAPVGRGRPDDAETAAAAERDRQRSAVERDAMQLFFSGDYGKSVAMLDKAERDFTTRLSPRGYFYRACALAAQALRSRVVDAKMLEDARRQYAEAVRGGQAALPDRRYVSPKILQALGS